MIAYKNASGNSGVIAYEPGSDYIKIRFQRSRKVYVYDYVVPGRTHVDQMKKLAASGHGLATYISQNVKKKYSRIE